MPAPFGRGAAPKMREDRDVVERDFTNNRVAKAGPPTVRTVARPRDGLSRGGFSSRGLGGVSRGGSRGGGRFAREDRDRIVSGGGGGGPLGESGSVDRPPSPHRRAPASASELRPRYDVYAPPRRAVSSANDAPPQFDRYIPPRSPPPPSFGTQYRPPIDESGGWRNWGDPDHRFRRRSMSPGPSTSREGAYSPSHPAAGYRVVSGMPGGAYRYALSPRDREDHSTGYGCHLSVSPPSVPEPSAESSRHPPPYTASAPPARQLSHGPASSADAPVHQPSDKGKGRAELADEDVNMEKPAQADPQEEVMVKTEPGLEDEMPAPKRRKEKQRAASQELQDIKPTLEELEAVVSPVDNPNATDGVLAFRSDGIPYKCHKAATSEERQAARLLFKTQQKAALALKGIQITRTVWRDDGVAFDWTRSKTLLALPRVQAAMGEMNVVPDGETEVEVEENVGMSEEKTERETGAQAQKATKQTSATSLAVSGGSSTLPEASSSSAKDVKMHEDGAAAVGEEEAAPVAASGPPASSAQAPDLPPAPASAFPPPPATRADTATASTSTRSKQAPSAAGTDRAPPAPHIVSGTPPPLAPGSISTLYSFQITLPSWIPSFTARKNWAMQACERYVDETRFMRVFVGAAPEHKDNVARIYIEPISMETARSFPDSMIPLRTWVDFPAHLRNMRPDDMLRLEWVHEQSISASQPDKRGRPVKWVKPLRSPKGITMQTRDRTPTEIASGGIDQATLDEVERVHQMSKGDWKKHLVKLAEAAVARAAASAKEEEEMNSGFQASAKLSAAGSSARPGQAVGTSRGGFIPKREYPPAAGSSNAAPRTLAVGAAARVGGTGGIGGAGATAVAAGSIGSVAGQGRAPQPAADASRLATRPGEVAHVARIGANAVGPALAGRPAPVATPGTAAARTLRPAGLSISRPLHNPTALPSSVSSLPPTTSQASASQASNKLSLNQRLGRISEIDLAAKRSLEKVGEGERVVVRSAGVERPQKVQRMDDGYRTVQARVTSGTTVSPALVARVPAGSTAPSAITRPAIKPNPPPSSSILTSVSAPAPTPALATASPPSRLDELNQQLSQLLIDINMFTDMMDEMPSARKQVNRLQNDIVRLYKEIGEEKEKGAGKKEH